MASSGAGGRTSGANVSGGGAGLRLGVGTSFGHYPPLSPIGSESEPQSNSASAVKAQREIKALEEDNLRLRRELAEMSSLYTQLVKESRHEKYDERRVNLLKSQMIQLERQILLLSEALGTRSATLLEVENALAAIADTCRCHLEGDRIIGTVQVTRTDLQSVVETAESARIKLYKNIENTSIQRLQRPLVLLSEFIKPGHQDSVSLLDICSGRLEHLNLRHVARLESKLSQLYTLLMSLHQSLSSLSSCDPDNKPVVNCEVPKAVYERMSGQTAKLSNLLKDVNSDLLELSILVPSAPWPTLRRGFCRDLSSDQVLQRLPPGPNKSKTETKQVLDSLLSAANYTVHMSQAETKVAKEELDFHKSVYNLQLQYSQSLLNALKDGYGQFEESANNILCQPLSEILRVYEHLKVTASEDALRKFLAVFKQHADQIEEAVKLLSPGENKGRGEAISSFGQQFYDSLAKLHSKCQQQRDDLVSDLDLVKQQHTEHMADMAAMFDLGNGQSKDDLVITNLTSGVQTLEVETKPAAKKSSPKPRPPWNTTSPADANASTLNNNNSIVDSCSCHQSPPKSTLEDRPPWVSDFSSPESPPDDAQMVPSIPTAADRRPPWVEDFASEPEEAAKNDDQVVADKPPQAGASSKSRAMRREGTKSKQTTDNLRKGVPRTKLVLRPREKAGSTTSGTSAVKKSESLSGLNKHDKGHESSGSHMKRSGSLSGDCNPGNV